MKKKLWCVYVVEILLIFSVISCKKRDYLKDALQGRAVLCFHLFTEGYEDTIFVCNASEYLKKELTKNFDIKDPGKYIYRHIKDSVPIRISKEYYLDQFRKSLLVKKDTLMQHIYEQEGVAGLLKNYFRKAGSLYAFSNTQERFPFVGQKPFPAFGRKQNGEWMSYLLSKHNIYLIHDVIIDGTLFTIIDSRCSDMEAVEKYWKESKELSYRRDPYAD